MSDLEMLAPLHHAQAVFAAFDAQDLARALEALFASVAGFMDITPVYA